VAVRVQHKLARADRIPFADDRFDVARAERVLQHCDDPGRVVAEMVRVVRPGGKLVLIDTDWASVSMSCLDPVVERDIAGLLLTAVPRPTVGRELGHLLRAAGCVIEDIRPHLIASRDVELIRLITRLPQFQAAALGDGTLTVASAEAWQASCEQLAAAGAFLGYAVITVAIGTVTP
jgi:SAM-dependent methyltransferase